MKSEFKVEFFKRATDQKPVFIRTISKKRQKEAPVKGVFEKICLFKGEDGFSIEFVGGINIIVKQFGGSIEV